LDWKLKKKKILRSQKDNLPSKQSTSTNAYNDLLKRMRNFHIITFLLGVIFVLTQFIALLNAINSGNSPPIYPNPNTFTTTNIVNGFTGFGFLHLLLIEIFTWWAWIPVSKQEISNNHELTYFSKSDHKSIQMENQTSLPLKMLALELSSTEQSVPVTEMFSQSSFTGGPDQDISVS